MKTTHELRQIDYYLFIDSDFVLHQQDTCLFSRLVVFNLELGVYLTDYETCPINYSYCLYMTQKNEFLCLVLKICYDKRITPLELLK